MSARKNLDGKFIIKTTNLLEDREHLVQKKLVDATKVYDTAKLHLNSAEEKIKHLDNHEYDPNCEFCCNNEFVKDAMKAKDALPELKEALREATINCVGIQQTIDTMEGVEEQYNQFNELKTRHSKGKIVLDKSNAELETEKTSLQLKENQLESVENNIQIYHANEANIQNNNRLNSEIENKRNELLEVSKQLKEVSTQLMESNGHIGSLTSKIQSIYTKMEEVSTLEDKFKTYEYYLDSVKRDGVSYELISKALPVIEGEVNNILHQIVDFGVTLQMDGKSINGKIDRVLVDAPCSGMGTLRRNPDLKWRQTPEGVAELNQKQVSILNSASRLLKPGGRLVYATCSLLRDENEKIAEAFERGVNVGFNKACNTIERVGATVVILGCTVSLIGITYVCIKEFQNSRCR